MEPQKDQSEFPQQSIPHHWEAHYHALQHAKSKYRLQETEPINLADFYLLGSKKNAIIWNTWMINEIKKTRLCLSEYEVEFDNASRYGGKSRVSSLYYLGLIKQDKDFGKALIRPETIRDKINELFHPIELDFPENPQFSSRYYVLAENESRFRSAMTYNLLNYLGELKGIEMEFKDDYCLFRMPKKNGPEEALECIEMCLELNKLLNGNGSV